MNKTEFKEELEKFLVKRVYMKKEGWKNGMTDLMEVAEVLSQVIESLTQGRLTVLVTTEDNPDNVQDVKLQLKDQGSGTVLGMLDRYFVTPEGHYPLELVAPGGNRVNVGDKEGLQHRTLGLFADWRVKCVEILAMHAK